ncbi:MAG: AAA family ATPase [Candidatus Kapabacteria bacterium]|nr:AAA family ATPase [Ignavibacteriota bacterium]MCW5886290.1 AAA family ATPase [Candidatus Kapabacteria bacterium]
MRINQIKLLNVLGIKQLEFNAGQFTEISGKNGQGKTSVIEAVKAALKGGNDATLLHNGAKEGEIVLCFDNGIELIKRIKNGKSDLTVKNNGVKLDKPQSFIDNLYDILSVNPVEFILSDKKKRTSALLEVLPVKIGTEKLLDILMDKTEYLVSDTSNNAFDVLAAQHKVIYDSRTVNNRIIKEKQSAVKQLQDSISDIDCDPRAIESELQSAQEQKQNMEQKKLGYLQKINNDANEKLEKLRQEYEQRQKEIYSEKENLTEKLNNDFSEKYQPLNDKISRLQEQMKSAGSAMKTKELINQYSSEISAAEKATEYLNHVLKSIESLKEELLNNLPIKGLEIREGEIYFDGVAFDRVNTAKQIEIAFEVAKLRAGELGIICIDGFEKFDDITYQLFVETAINSGLQIIGTKVTNDELTISTN